ncbi:MAG: helix-turn-helix domain-containing protein [Phycisphaerales bacterium]|nr:helix-turn-helix domain-containing protein [Phycisphaerales bacterium]
MPNNPSTPLAKPDSTIPRLSLRPSDAAKALDISERKLFSLTASGEIPCVKFDNVKLYRVAALEESLRRKEEETRNGSSVRGKRSKS